MTRKGNPVAAVLVALATGGVIVFLVERLADQLNPSDGTATMPMTRSTAYCWTFPFWSPRTA